VRAAIAALALALPGAAQQDSWARVWTEVETLRSGRVSRADQELLRLELVKFLQECEESPRGELLRASLEALAGRDTSTVSTRLASLAPDFFAPREQWLLADLLPPCPERARLVLGALRTPAPLADWQVLLAWNTAADEIRELRLEESALPIQAALHERYQASWSALDLAATYRMVGWAKEADDVLAIAIARETSAERRGELWTMRGLTSMGFGDERHARDYLGMALAEGDEGAALVLAGLDLAAGRIPAAREGFQALILDSPPPERAWRGWGATLLPPASVAPSSASLPSE